MQEALEFHVGELLRARGWGLALGESCTGGLVGHRITQAPGSSDYFVGGVIAYSNEIKERLLGVRSQTLEAHGAVSRETALEMARGARETFGAEVGGSVTGIAGPGGGTDQKPVGLTWIAVCTPEGEWAERHVFEGDRRQNKVEAAHALLALLANQLDAA